VSVESVIFDLDGTLVDSLPGIEACLAETLERVIPGAVLPPVRDAIGPGVDRMCALLLPDASAEDLDAVVRGFRAAYDAGGWRFVQAYPGVPEVLAALVEAGRTLYVVTNKPELPARLILEELGLLELFTEVVAKDSASVPYVSKADALADLMTGFAIHPDTALLVGDSVDDADAAQVCRVPFVAASYGYGTGAASANVVATIADITELPGVVARLEVVA
jgi:phosphoglycolate phosphatase